MKKPIIIAMLLLFFSSALTLAEDPPGLEKAVEKADGVIVGLNDNFGDGAHSFMEAWVLTNLKGEYAGEKITVYFPPETVPDGGIMNVLKKHGTKYIIAYKGPVDEKGRFKYVGPVFDSREIIATSENTDKIKPGSFGIALPSLKEAFDSSDIVAKAIYLRYDPNEALNKFVFNIRETIKGDIEKGKTEVMLDGMYLHWFTEGGTKGMQEKLNPLLSGKSVILFMNQDNDKYYYSGPALTSPELEATEVNIALAKNEPAQEAQEHDWTWWILAAVAAVAALIAALLASKIDYKYDRRRERLEKLRSNNPDNDSDKPNV